MFKFEDKDADCQGKIWKNLSSIFSFTTPPIFSNSDQVIVSIDMYLVDVINLVS